MSNLTQVGNRTVLVAIAFLTLLTLWAFYFSVHKKILKNEQSKESKLCGNVCQMLKLNERKNLWNYVRWKLSEPPAITCKNPKTIGIQDGITGQEPYKYCSDDPWKFSVGECLVYSFGIANLWGFDDQVATDYKCEVFAFDPSMNIADNTRRSSGVVFNKIGIYYEDTIYVPDGSELYGNANPDIVWQMRTLRSIWKQFKHENRYIDMLKIDVDGAEVKALIQALDDGFMKRWVRQLSLEWHLFYYNVYSTQVLLNIVTVRDKLIENGFLLYEKDSRNVGSWSNPTVWEGFFTVDSFVNVNLAEK